MTSTTSLVPTTEPTEPCLIKTDAVGRVHRTPEQRERILQEYERSGLSGPKFAALCGVRYQTLAGWLARGKGRSLTHPRREAQHNPESPVRWLEASVQPSAAASAGGLVLHLPGGVRAHVSSQEHVALAAALVRSLEKPC
jgi:hypothetical protein